MTNLDSQSVAERQVGLVSVDGRVYPLEFVRVAGRAEGGISQTKLTQRFANPHAEALEVVYTLALPADGAVLGYTIRMGETVIRGEVQPREKAEAAYHEALYQGRTAGLLEQDRADTFQQRLGNLPPHTVVEAEIEIAQPLAFLTGVGGGVPQWEYRFPTVVGVRYEGAAGRVQDAGKLDVARDVDGGIPTRVKLEFAIADVLDGDGDVASPSHGLVCEREPGGTMVRFAGRQRLDRDIVLRWQAAADNLGLRVLEGRGLEGDDGRYALVTLVPPAVPSATFHRDLTVLIDASGSMSGPPLQLAKQVVDELVRSLQSGDRFELLAFANRVVSLTDGLTEVDAQTTDAALRALNRLRAGGATEMVGAVEEALASLRDGAQRQVVLVTDGYVGFEAEVIARIAQRPLRGTRVHAVGIGAAPNRALLQGVARAGRGVELLVGDDSAAVEAAKRLCAATVRPVLTDLATGGSAVLRCAPEQPRDIFAGQPLVFTAELRREGGTIELTGRLAGTPSPWTASVEVPALGMSAGLRATPLPIGALHGREVIGDLELELAAGRDSDLVLPRIEECGMRHCIVSRRTSLVAIAEEPSVDPRQPRRRERLAVELPAGVSAEGTGLLGPSPVSAKMWSVGAREGGTPSASPPFRIARAMKLGSSPAPPRCSIPKELAALARDFGVAAERDSRRLGERTEHLRRELEAVEQDLVLKLETLHDMTLDLRVSLERERELWNGEVSGIAEALVRSGCDGGVEELRRISHELMSRQLRWWNLLGEIAATLGARQTELAVRLAELRTLAGALREATQEVMIFTSGELKNRLLALVQSAHPNEPGVTPGRPGRDPD